MKYYKDKDNNVFAYEEDGSQDAYIGKKTPMTAEEVELHLNPPKTQDQIAAEEEEAAVKALEALNRDALHLMRAWIASQPSAPKEIKDNSAAAVAVIDKIAKAKKL